MTKGREKAVPIRQWGWILAFIGVVAGAGCASRDMGKETVASVDGDEIKVLELREFLGVRGGKTAASDVPIEKKKEALDRLIAGRILAGEAGRKGMDNTDDYRKAVAQFEEAVLVSALFRKEADAKFKVSESDLKERAGKMRESDKTLSQDNAVARAGRMLAEAGMRKIQEDLIAAARKEIPATVNQEVVDRIGKKAKVPDDAVLATVGGDNVTYGDVKGLLRRMASGPHGGQDLASNPVAVSRMLDQEMTGRVLAAFARKQGVAGTEWHKSVRRDMERSVLIDMIAEREVLKGITVSDREIQDAYREHGEMFIREGKKIPLAEVKEDIRRFLENDKRKKALEAYLVEVKKKAKITIREDVLPKV